LALLDLLEGAILGLQVKCFEASLEDLGDDEEASSSMHFWTFLSACKLVVNGIFVVCAAKKMLHGDLVAFWGCLTMAMRVYPLIIGFVSMAHGYCYEHILYMPLQGTGLAIVVALHCLIQARIQQARPPRQSKSPDLEQYSHSVSKAKLEADCCICLEGMVVGEVVCTLPCKHSFHKPCLEAWLRQSKRCPLRCNIAALEKGEEVDTPAISLDAFPRNRMVEPEIEAQGVVAV